VLIYVKIFPKYMLVGSIEHGHKVGAIPSTAGNRTPYSPRKKCVPCLSVFLLAVWIYLSNNLKYLKEWQPLPVGMFNMKFVCDVQLLIFTNSFSLLQTNHSVRFQVKIIRFLYRQYNVL